MKLSKIIAAIEDKVDKEKEDLDEGYYLSSTGIEMIASNYLSEIGYKYEDAQEAGKAITDLININKSNSTKQHN